MGMFKTQVTMTVSKMTKMMAQQVKSQCGIPLYVGLTLTITELITVKSVAQANLSAI